jgi:hypothetical protein
LPDPSCSISECVPEIVHPSLPAHGTGLLAFEQRLARNRFVNPLVM